MKISNIAGIFCLGLMFSLTLKGHAEKTVYVYDLEHKNTLTANSVRHIHFRDNQLNLYLADGTTTRFPLDRVTIFSTNYLGATLVEAVEDMADSDVAVKVEGDDIIFSASAPILSLEIYGSAGNRMASAAPSASTATVNTAARGLLIARIVTADNVFVKKIVK